MDKNLKEGRNLRFGAKFWDRDWNKANTIKLSSSHWPEFPLWSRALCFTYAFPKFNIKLTVRPTANNYSASRLIISQRSLSFGKVCQLCKIQKASFSKGHLLKEWISRWHDTAQGYVKNNCETYFKVLGNLLGSEGILTSLTLISNYFAIAFLKRKRRYVNCD